MGIPAACGAAYDTALRRAAAHLMADGAQLQIGVIRGIPLHDSDIEGAHGIPPPVSGLKDAITAGGGLLPVTPEYNSSFPGVFKNAIDWLSRPPADVQRVFGGKPVALIGALAGGVGTMLRGFLFCARKLTPCGGSAVHRQRPRRVV